MIYKDHIGGIDLRDDFTGFFFDKYYSRDLGLYRVSDGDRYSQFLVPSFENKTSQVIGSDQTLYFSSEYKDRIIKISVAYDHLTEVQLKNIQRIFATKDPKRLIFDEEPYKYYLVKLNSQPEFTYICFYEDGQRIYKGEGSFEFAAFYPYARGISKYLEDFPKRKYTNLLEWAHTSGIKIRTKDRTKDEGKIWDYFNPSPPESTTYIARIYNGGEIPTHWRLFIPWGEILNEKEETIIGIPNSIIGFTDGETQLGGACSFKDIPKSEEDTSEGIIIDSEKHIIIGGNSDFTKTGIIYNEFLDTWHFERIALGESFMQIESAGVLKSADILIKYDYIYY